MLVHTQFDDYFRKFHLHPETNHQFFMLQVQLDKSIKQLHAIGTGKHAQIEGSGVGGVIDHRHECAERCAEVLEGEICEAEHRETTAEVLLDDALDPSVVKLNATNTMVDGKIFSGMFWGFCIG